jgi:hypothetical protein
MDRNIVHAIGVKTRHSGEYEEEERAWIIAGDSRAVR